MTPNEVLSALLDADRLRVAGALVEHPSTIDGLVDDTGLDRRTVLEAIGALRTVTVVEADGDRYEIRSAALRRLARELSPSLDLDVEMRRGMTDDEIRILERFFSGRALVEIPAGPANRRVVLERLALEFEIGRRYSEPEVNEILQAFSADHVTLRRYLIDEELLDRERNVYWRSGGRTGVT